MKLADDLDFGRMPAFQLVELLRLSESLETKPERETEGGRERERERERLSFRRCACGMLRFTDVARATACSPEPKAEYAGTLQRQR